MNAHTPGPWRLDTDLPKVIVSGDGETLAQTFYMYGDKERAITQAEANARLIAASPAIVEELTNFRAWLMYWKTRTISQQSKDERGHVTNSWAACPIPDWDVKQKLESIEQLLSSLEAQSTPKLVA